jgi:hypothetical protein
VRLIVENNPIEGFNDRQAKLQEIKDKSTALKYSVS